MNLLECLRSALIAIRSNKLRSLLTMLGIIIGISAVITITMLGSTLSASVSNAVAEFGGNSVNVEIYQEWVRDPETGEVYSSTRVREALESGNTALAEKLLGGSEVK